jgi:hypothetical protein
MRIIPNSSSHRNFEREWKNNLVMRWKSEIKETALEDWALGHQAWLPE